MIDEKGEVPGIGADVTATGAGPSSVDTLTEEIVQLVAQVLDVAADTLSAQTTSDDVPQWDSLGYLRLLMAIEERYGVRVELVSISELNSVARIVEYLAG